MPSLPLSPWFATMAAFGLLCATGRPAAALEIEKIDKAPDIDGALADFPLDTDKLDSRVKGLPQASDLSAKGKVAYDDKDLYIALDVSDDVFAPGATGDHAEFVVVIGNTTTTVSLIPGQPGKTAGKATLGGKEIKGAKVVEAPRKGGYTLEAKLPWSALGGSARQRVGLRGGLFVFDSDGTAIDAVVGSSSSLESAQLPMMPTSPEVALTLGLLKEKRLGSKPSFTALGNVVGDAMLESVLVFGNHLVVLGPTFRKGREYYFNDMGDKDVTSSVLALELRDLDGDGRDELIFRKRFTKSGQHTSRDVLQIYGFGSSDTASILFQHEIGLKNPKGSVVNDVTFATEAGKLTLTIRPGTAKGLDQKNYDEPTEGSFDPVLLPWGQVLAQSYRHDGRTISKSDEKTRPKAVSVDVPKPPATPVKAPEAPKPPDTAKVYALYKKDRGITEAARFDLAADVDGNSQIERVTMHPTPPKSASLGRPELSVFGPGFRNGAGYAFLTLPFANAGDVKNVSVKDVTGDGKADIIVRGVLKTKGSDDVEVIREVELVFRVGGDQIKRIFGAEVERRIGQDRIMGQISYQSPKAGSTIVLSAGRAIGFTKASYPFAEDKGPVGGLEPLLLPWGDTQSVSYRLQASGFVKR